jgi:hypothetical protein
VLNAAPWNLNEDNVASMFALDGSRTPPKNPDGYFIIIRTEAAPPGVGLKTTVSVWVHRSRSKGTTYNGINAILDRIMEIMKTATHVVGTDGSKLTQTDFAGLGGEQHDPGYDTLTRYVAFNCLSGKAVMR